jgi:hypothetical protein
MWCEVNLVRGQMSGIQFAMIIADLVDDQEVRLRNSRTSFPWDFITTLE